MQRLAAGDSRQFAMRVAGCCRAFLLFISDSLQNRSSFTGFGSRNLLVSNSCVMYACNLTMISVTGKSCKKYILCLSGGCSSTSDE